MTKSTTASRSCTSALIKAAFRSDLTRVVTFQFSPGTNHVSFANLWPPDPSVFNVHHTTSHDPDSPNMLEFLTRVESGTPSAWRRS